MMPHRCAAIVLAAGAGSRFAGPGHKLSATIGPNGDGRPETVIDRAVSAALDADIGPVIVVTGALEDVVPERLAQRVVICHNDRWADGQMTSLRAGLAAAAAMHCTVAVVGLGDQPFVTADAWRRMAEAEGPIGVATYDGRRGNPVRLEAAVWALLPDSGDEGARALMRVREDLVREVPCTGSPRDIDTHEDLRRWQSN
jgi:molybdenum cofactor cytidylyltransferase